MTSGKIKIYELMNSKPVNQADLIPISQSNRTRKASIGDVSKTILFTKITYNDLLNKMKKGELIPGMKYLITDYQTIYKQPETGNICYGHKTVLKNENEPINDDNKITEDEESGPDIGGTEEDSGDEFSDDSDDEGGEI